MPYEQHVINKYIYQEKVGKNERKTFERIKDLGFTPMQYYKKIKGYKDSMIKTRTRSIAETNVKDVLQSTIAQHYSAVKLKANK